ncbi:MAG: OmpA family protein, partial [bacterium]
QNRLRDLEAKQTDRGVVLTLGDVLFASGESSLRDSALEEIKTLAQFLQEYPDQDVRVEGHTDSRGKASLNQAISQKRAEAVMDALVGFGVKESRLLAVGYGESRPVAGNETEQGRAKNRRVEVVLLDEK